MTTESQKTVAQALDNAANRCGHIDLEPASSKQCWFLAGLMIKAGWNLIDVNCQWSNTQAMLTKRQASRWIDELLNSTN